jgi:hypothetical protein
MQSMTKQIKSVWQAIKVAVPVGVALTVLQTREKGMKSKLFRWGLTALMVGTLAACGGGGGSSTPAAATGGTTGGTTAGTAPAVAVPTGTAPVTLTATTPAATFAALAPTVAVGGVSINSPPCVSYSMADANGNGIIGFGSAMKRSTDAVASYPNLAFSLPSWFRAPTAPRASGSAIS